MAINEQVDAYLRDLYERSISPPDAMPGEEAVEPFTYGTAGAERPRFDRTLSPGGVVIEDEGEPIVRPYSESGFAQRDRAAAMAQPIAPEQPSEAASYLSALRAAQRQDELAAMAARTMAPAEEIARIQSRGLYRPSGVPGLPSATEQLKERQKAVQDMLAMKRGERAEARQELAAEQDIELNRAQIARQSALMEADKLRLAMEQGEAPYKVMELQANVRKALAQAQLAEETAKAKGRPVVVMPRPAKEPKAPPSEKPKEPKIIPGIPPDYDINPSKPPSTEQINKFGNIVSTKYELQGMTNRMRKLASQFSLMERTKPGSAKTLVSQLATQIQIKAKDIAELGALSGPDMGLMKAMASNPSSIETAFVDVQAQLDGLDWWSQNAENSKARAWGFKKIEQPMPGTGAPQDGGVAPSKEDAARAAVAAFKAAQAAGADAATLERLRSEAQKAVDAVKPSEG